jgi:hypothetical protein
MRAMASAIALFFVQKYLIAAWACEKYGFHPVHKTDMMYSHIIQRPCTPLSRSLPLASEWAFCFQTRVSTPC